LLEVLEHKVVYIQAVEEEELVKLEVRMHLGKVEMD